MAGIGGILAGAGAVKQGIDTGVAFQEDRDYLNAKRGREGEIYGIQKELATNELDDQRRTRANDVAYRTEFGKGATWEGLAKTAQGRGDQAGYEHYSTLRDKAEKEGVIDVLQALQGNPDMTGDELARISNAKGNYKVDTFKTQKVMDKDGKVTDVNITPIKDGQPVATYSLNRKAQLYGLTVKPKYDIKEGYRLNETTGEVEALPERDKQFAPNTYFEKIEETSADGTKRQRLIDLRNGTDVTPDGKHVDNGISRQDNEQILSSVKSLYKISDLESMDDTGRTKLGQAIGVATQLYKNGAVDRQGRKLSTNEVAALAGDIVDGRLKPEDAQRLYLPHGGRVSAPAAGGGNAEAPPMEGARKAKDGNWYLQKEGKWYQVVGDAPAAKGAPAEPQVRPLPADTATRTPLPNARPSQSNPAAQRYLELRDRIASLQGNVGLPGGVGIASGKRDASINKEVAGLQSEMSSLGVSPEDAERYDAQRRITDLDRQIQNIPPNSPSGPSLQATLQAQRQQLVDRIENQGERAREQNRNTVMTQPGIAAPVQTATAAAAPAGGIAPQPQSAEPQPFQGQPPSPGIDGGIVPASAPAVMAPAPGGIAPDSRGPGYMSPEDVAAGGKTPVLQKNGSISTEKTITVEADGKHYVIPTIIDGKSYTPEAASKAFRDKQIKPIGVFNTPEEAKAFAEQRSRDLDRNFGGQGVLHKGPSAPAKGELRKVVEPEYRSRDSFGANSPTDYINKVTPYMNSEAPKRLGVGDIDWMKKWLPWMAKADPQRATRYVRAINDTIRGGRKDGPWAKFPKGRQYDLDQNGNLIVAKEK